MLALYLALTSTAPAADPPDVAAGGVAMHSATVFQVDGFDLWAGQAMGCVGGQGFQVDHKFRLGGEGHICGSTTGSFLAFGGAHAGMWLTNGPFAFSPYATLGLGGTGQGQPAVDYEGSLLVFVRPTAAVSVSFGVLAVELAAYSTLGAQFATWGDQGSPQPHGLVWSGGQLSLLFGDFWRHHEHDSREPVTRTGTGESLDKATSDLGVAVDDATKTLTEALKSAEGEEARQAIQEVADALREAAKKLDEAVDEEESLKEEDDEEEGSRPVPADG
jgi:hypothetical protein